MNIYVESVLNAARRDNARLLEARKRYEEEVEKINKEKEEEIFAIISNAIFILKNKEALGIQDCIDLAFFCDNADLSKVNDLTIGELNDKLWKESLLLKNGKLHLMLKQNEGVYSLSNKSFIEEILKNGVKLQVDMRNIKAGEKWIVELYYNTDNYEEDPYKLNCTLNPEATQIRSNYNHYDLNGLLNDAIPKIKAF